MVPDAPRGQVARAPTDSTSVNGVAVETNATARAPENVSSSPDACWGHTAMKKIIRWANVCGLCAR